MIIFFDLVEKLVTLRNLWFRNPQSYISPIPKNASV